MLLRSSRWLGFAECLLVFAAGSFTRAEELYPSRAYITPPAPLYLATGDLNGDGWPDLVMSDRSSLNFTVLRSLGFGEFSPPVPSTSSGPGPVGPLAVGRLNKDALDDVVVVGGNGLRIAASRDGGPAPPAQIDLPNALITSLALDDFNGDQILDIAVLIQNAHLIVILKGGGDGSFDYLSAFQPGRLPVGFVVADLNGDHRPDLVVSDFCGQLGPLCQPEIVTFLGRGDGEFDLGSRMQIRAELGPVAVADLDGDGRADLLDGESVPQDLALRIGNGDGTFDSPIILASGLNPIDIAVADLNEDGLRDILLPFPTSTNSEIVYLPGRRGDVPGPPTRWTLATSARAMRIADLDGDGHLDLALANVYDGLSPGLVYLLFGDGLGGFSQRRHVNLGAPVSSIATADFNRDGHLDLAIPDRFGAQVRVLAGSGAVSFQTASYPVGDAPVAASVGDFNNDGISDLLVVNATSSDVSVLLGQADGTFAPETRSFAGQNPTAVAVADFNGDGRLDVGVTFSCYGSSDPGCIHGVAILLGRGDGSFPARLTFPSGFDPRGIDVGDFNRDGRMDIVVANYQDNSAILVGSGDGTFGPAMPLSAGRASQVLVRDFNRDGIDDLLLLSVCFASDPVCSDGEIQWLAGRGDGTFLPAYRTDAGPAPNGLIVGDFDADGRLDVAVPNSISGTASVVSIIKGHDDGHFYPRIDFTAPLGASALAGGDFDGDGRNDLAIGTAGYAIAPTLGVLDGVDILINQGPLPDADGDGVLNSIDACTDSDQDGFGDPGLPGACPADNCPNIPNPSQQDGDHDGIGDACDRCTDGDNDGSGDPGYPGNLCPVDNCPSVSPGSQADADADGLGDLCDSCTDTDGDGLADPNFPANTCATDNCPGVSNVDQTDSDGDGIGDACDLCPDDASNDQDLDGVCGAVDNCPQVSNHDQSDFDQDGEGDVCDLDDGLILVRFLAGAIGFQSPLDWQDEASFSAYNVYRGSLKSLVDHNGDGAADQYGTCLKNSILNPPAAFYDSPPLGDGYFYIVTGLSGATETGLGTASSGAPRAEFVSCRSLYGDPPSILGASVTESTEQAVCDFTATAEIWLSWLGATVFATPGPILIGGEYTQVRIEASVADPDSTPAQNDIAQVVALYSIGGSTPESTKLLDDGGATQEQFVQRAASLPEDCEIISGSPHCFLATYWVDSNDTVADDGLFTRVSAFLSPVANPLLSDCIALSRKQASLIAYAGSSLGFTIAVQDREGNITILPAAPAVVTGDSTFGCTGDPCMCCILTHSGLAPECYGLAGAIGPDFPTGLCVAVAP